MAHTGELSAHRAAVLQFRSDPGESDSPDAYEYWPDGLLIVSGEHVERVGPASELIGTLPAGVCVHEHHDALILPGFIDTHIHYPQTDVIAAAGRDLLDWLEHYTFPAERRFDNEAHAKSSAEFFLDELARNGTTTAQVLGTVHKLATDVFFEAAAKRGIRMIAGKLLMDRNCPEYLRDTPADGERDTRELIEKWHGQGRLHYAITPRFAPTSSNEQLASAGRIARDHPDVFIHSHLAENVDEVAWVHRLFPEARSYLDVYDRFGLLRERATYAHCIHLDAADRQRMASAGSSAAFCPTSNFYLGSGLFDIAAADAAALQFALATDVGGGTSFSMLRTMAEAYKVTQLLGQRLSPLRMFYLATLGGARVLGLHDRIGQLSPGAEADFVVLDPHVTPLMSRRFKQCATLAERLLLFATLGDERNVVGTYIVGKRVHAAPGVIHA
ncbi:MAG TPA: guanine deaminase [Steroidobacter sp.]|uniref:guanine deaminase n=1 Tax=Steroidobacter sp. TaxID=1978227 RepID=UPI002EDA358B